MAVACAGNDELWRECAAWLARWEVLRPDHRANLDGAAIGDLANTLRDGVVLCRLLVKVDPTCVDVERVNLKPAFARFLCLRNIQLFLSVCKSHFHLSEQDLFEDVMLFDLCNFHKVLCTLSKLSLVPKVSKCVPGFHAKSSKTREEEEIYQRLESKEPPKYDALNEIYGPIVEHDSEGTYRTFVHENRTVGASVDEPYEKRDHVIKELIDTERNYVEVLTKLHRNFYKKLKGIMQPDILEVVFFKIPELLETHERFLDQLGKLGNRGGIKLSAVFVTSRESFLTYGEYCANLSNACLVLQEQCDRHPEICRKVEELEKQDNNGRFKLRDVLSVPMQRVLKYHLLLDKLVEYTDPKHEEYKDLKRARECMIDINGYINEYSRDTELLSVIRQIRENITNWDAPIAPEHCGRLVKDGELRIRPHDDGKPRTRYAFVFQRYIVLCKASRDGRFEYRDALPLAEMDVQDCAGGGSGEGGGGRALLHQNGRWGYQFYLFKTVQSTAYTCSAKTPQLKERMVNALRECIDNIKLPEYTKTPHKYEMQTFAVPTLCWYCSKYLKGLLFQGYRCRECGSSVHRDCLPYAGACGPPKPASAFDIVQSRPSNGANSSLARLSERLWFVGEMDRQTAAVRLRNRPNGTFLVRLRAERGNSGGGGAASAAAADANVKYAMSLKTEDTVKHMKICATDDVVSPKYFLSGAKYFNSLEDLVRNYQANSLKESFERLQDSTKLEYAFKNMRAVASKDYEARNEKEMSLRAGQEVIIYRQEGYGEGWLLGSSHSNGRTKNGFFPEDCVQILELLHAQ